MSTAADMPRRLGDLSEADFRKRLAGPGCRMQIGPFVADIRARTENLHAPLHKLYQDYPLRRHGTLASFHVSLENVRRWSRPGRRLVRFYVDGRAPHEDLPAGQALAVLEWGLNLVIALRMHCYLMLHAAVLERGGRVLLLPAAPGFGKSTLCAALASRDWRLLSDEFGLIRPGTEELLPLPRPIALKNESIEVMRTFSPDAYIGPSIPDTRKGTVAHVKPSRESITRAAEAAAAALIVFPRWEPDAELELEELQKAESFMLLATNAFNYELHGEAGFDTVAALIERCRCYRLRYSDLDEVTAALAALIDEGDV